jgi:NAD-dependent oxidoreductase involved in siderophore biosynthesis
MMRDAHNRSDRQQGRVTVISYLSGEGVLITSERVTVVVESAVVGAQGGEVALQLLGLRVGEAVLEPDGDLARLQAKVARDAGMTIPIFYR